MNKTKKLKDNLMMKKKWRTKLTKMKSLKIKILMMVSNGINKVNRL